MGGRRGGGAGDGELWSGVATTVATAAPVTTSVAATAAIAPVPVLAPVTTSVAAIVAAIAAATINTAVSAYNDLCFQRRYRHWPWLVDAWRHLCIRQDGGRDAVL